MKSENWISGTGLSPYIAIPIAVPMIPPSASGVSITRSGPNSSYSPAVARNTPPNLPTSSPSTIVRASRRISMRSASFTACRRLRVGMARRALAFHQSTKEELGRAVRGTDQRSRRDIKEAIGLRHFLVLGELLGRDELLHPQVVLRGLQVLPQRE